MKTEGDESYKEIIVSEFIILKGVILAPGGPDEDTDGSSQLVHTLAENKLIDEYKLHVYPLGLGTGKKMFPEGCISI